MLEISFGGRGMGVCGGGGGGGGGGGRRRGCSAVKKGHDLLFDYYCPC